VTDDGIVRIRDGDTEVAAVRATLLTEAPTYARDGVKPRWLDELQSFDFSALSDVASTAYNGSARGNMTSDLLLDLLASPEIASKRIVWRQYDHQVGTNTVVGPGSDAAVVRIKGTKKALAISTDGDAAYTYLDPYAGGAIAVCEAARNVACAGARPLAMTNCLNFGNPEKPEVYWQLSQAIRGMADAARALGIPVISGNVSLYNETNGEPIWPTPVVGVVGLIDDVDRVVPMGFHDAGDVVLVAGSESPDTTLGGSELMSMRGVLAGKPTIDLDAESRLQRFLLDTVDARLLKSAHDVSSGGLAVAVAESCIAGGIGAQFDAGVASTREQLFGEAQSRAVVSCGPGDQQRLVDLAKVHSVALRVAGIVGGTLLVLGGAAVPVSGLREAYESGLPRAIEGVAANV
jgi:phosphoribosylformylglycinamidine synthase